jgi:hypothetical protein
VTITKGKYYRKGTTIVIATETTTNPYFAGTVIETYEDTLGDYKSDRDVSEYVEYDSEVILKPVIELIDNEKYKEACDLIETLQKEEYASIVSIAGELTYYHSLSYFLRDSDEYS